MVVHFRHIVTPLLVMLLFIVLLGSVSVWLLYSITLALISTNCLCLISYYKLLYLPWKHRPMPVYLFHFPELCSIECKKYVLVSQLRKIISISTVVSVDWTCSVYTNLTKLVVHVRICSVCWLIDFRILVWSL